MSIAIGIYRETAAEMVEPGGGNASEMALLRKARAGGFEAPGLDLLRRRNSGSKSGGCDGLPALGVGAPPAAALVDGGEICSR